MPKSKYAKNDPLYLVDEADFVDEEDEDGIPFVCTTCGGPYPNCKDSCKIFDDD